MAIKSFGDKRTAALFQHGGSPDFPAELGRAAKRKLEMIHLARAVETLRIPPGNRLEKLRGDRAGWYSIRINKQWRVIFIWDDGPDLVKVVDYHD